MLTAKDPKLLYGVQIAGVGQEAVRDLPGFWVHCGILASPRWSYIRSSTITRRDAAQDDRGGRPPRPCRAFCLADIENSIEFARELGLAYMVAMLPRPRPESLHQYRAIAARLNEAGARVRSHGMEFALLFHNHELMPQQGSSGLVELMNHTDAALVQLEVDIYWIAQAGLDPASFLGDIKSA